MTPSCMYSIQNHSRICFQFTSTLAIPRCFCSHCVDSKHRGFCWGLEERWRLLSCFKSPSEIIRSRSSQIVLLDIHTHLVWHLPGFHRLCLPQLTYVCFIYTISPQNICKVNRFVYIYIVAFFSSQKNSYFPLLHFSLSFEVLLIPAFCCLWDSIYTCFVLQRAWARMQTWEGWLASLIFRPLRAIIKVFFPGVRLCTRNPPLQTSTLGSCMQNKPCVELMLPAVLKCYS